MTIFIDESGFTGNNLLDANQPYFVLSSVSISDAKAQDLVNRVRTEFQIEDEVDELKAGSLLKNPRGKKAVKYILDNLQGKYAISVHHKSYALCCKFFEYVFEPVLQENKSFFYTNSFHLFIADILFLFSVSEDKVASEIMGSFEKMMRERDFDALRNFFLNKVSLEIDDVFTAIIDFMEGYSGAIIEEMDDIKTTTDGGKWMLELSNTSLFSLLIHWAKSHDEMTVICDESEPLETITPYLDKMFGGTDKAPLLHPLTGHRLPTPNLKQNIQFKDSKDFAGIQLADIVAGSATYALKNKDTDFLNILHESIIDESIFPTHEHLDLTKKQPTLNLCILQELAERARNKSDPFLGLVEYYEFMSKRYDTSPPEMK